MSAENDATTGERSLYRVGTADWARVGFALWCAIVDVWDGRTLPPSGGWHADCALDEQGYCILETCKEVD